MITTEKTVMARLGIGAFVVVGFVYLRVTTQDRLLHVLANYSKTCLKRPLSKRRKFSFQDRLSLNAGQ